eukprot:NODE_3_length_80033_cov_0.932970.p9 type:complete len:561 gc:universal NODE_3_length_80033_cov_0.932970:10967-12649(+)
MPTAVLEAEAEIIKFLEGTDKLSTEYWQLQKIVKFIQSGNYSTTLIGIVAMKDFELGSDSFSLGLKHSFGMMALINLLKTKEYSCICGSFEILIEVTKKLIGCVLFSQYCGLEVLLNLLDAKNESLVSNACLLLSQVLAYDRNQSEFIKGNGFQKLLNVLNIRYGTKIGEHSAKAIYICLGKLENRQYMVGLPITFYDKMLNSGYKPILPHIVGILSKMTSDRIFRREFEAYGLLKKCLEFLQDSDDSQLLLAASEVVSNCESNEKNLNLIKEKNFIDKILSQLFNLNLKESSTISLLGALKFASGNLDLSKKLTEDSRLIDYCIQCLDSESENIAVASVSLLVELARADDGKKFIKSKNLLDNFILMLKTTNVDLMEQIAYLFGVCAQDSSLLKDLYAKGGVGFMWSLLKSDHANLQAASAQSMGPFIANISSGNDLIRSFVGSVELVVNLLKSNNTRVLSSACLAISNISKDPENLEIVTDQGIVELFSNLVKFDEIELQKSLCLAISSCSLSARNRSRLIEFKLLDFIIKCLLSSDIDLKVCASKSVFEFSKDGQFN